ncbi:MAG: hypothetical protein EP315_07205 [Gammaproteobacteria bacterium]|nr:MAG: hypothetical protein EP315_07205 [Gammaproteobacteria bacterium]
MEFFRSIDDLPLDSQQLKAMLLISHLPALCQSINSVLWNAQDHGKIYCLWGEFSIRREELKHGVRFSLPECPNALAWTITRDHPDQAIVIHCTINKTEHDQDFIDSIHQFMHDLEQGLLQQNFIRT